MEKKKIDFNKIKAGDIIATLSDEDYAFINEYYAEKKIIADLTRNLLNGLIKDEIRMNKLWEKYVPLEDAVRICCKDNLTIGIQRNKVVVSEKNKDC